MREGARRGRFRVDHQHVRLDRRRRLPGGADAHGPEMKRRGVITTVRAPPLLAYQILLHTAQAFSADVLLVMGHDRLYAELCADLQSQNNPNSPVVVKLPRSGGVVQVGRAFGSRRAIADVRAALRIPPPAFGAQRDQSYRRARTKQLISEVIAICIRPRVRSYNLISPPLCPRRAPVFLRSCATARGRPRRFGCGRRDPTADVAAISIHPRAQFLRNRGQRRAIIFSVVTSPGSHARDAIAQCPTSSSEWGECSFPPRVCPSATSLR